MSDRLRGGTTIAGYTAYHKGNLLKETLDAIGISYTSVTGTPTSLKNPYALTIGSGLTLSSGSTYDGSTALTLSWSHPDTSSQASSDNTGYTYIQDITLDGAGHVTAIGTATWSHPDTSTQASLNALTGVDVISDIDLDGAGHVTSMSTRSLTYANLLTLFTPTVPTTLSLAETASGVNVTFTPKDSAADRYEVWSSYDNADFALVGVLNASDVVIDTPVTLFDDSNNRKGLIYYRVYCVKAGVKSIALASSITTTNNAPEVTNLVIIPYEDFLEISYDIPNDLRISHVEVKLHAHTSSGSLSEGSATLIYSGNRSSVTYTIPPSEKAYYFRAWVSTITRTT